MMRLPTFDFLAPTTLEEAARMIREEGPEAMVVAGGTDVYPNMKRRQWQPKSLVALGRIKELKGVSGSPEKGIRIGAGETLTALERNATVKDAYPGLWKAIQSISTPILRNMGTIGGNICLDTRCNYYDQNYEWRRGINFCMKCDGDTCWVAPASKICLAVQSSDTAPVLCALGAKFRLASADGERVIEAQELYNRDGISYLTKAADEILVDIELPATNHWKSTYWKLRRRGAFDFPILGVAAKITFDGDIVSDARIVLGAVSMCPVEASDAQQVLIGKPLTEDTIREAADLAFKVAKPTDNTDLDYYWRKQVTRHYVAGALREVGGLPDPGPNLIQAS